MNRICTLAIALIALSGAAQQRVSILGDSYSTFAGQVSPEWNLVWYLGEDTPAENPNDVRSVDQTWWKLYLDRTGNVLEKNNSFSGATICCTGYGQEDYSDRAFITRMYNLGNPDIIFIFGGTNDSWAQAPIGEYKYADFSKADLMTFRPAFAYMLSEMQRLYPDAVICNLTNSELSDEVTNSMDEICRHYGVKNILLHDIDKQWGHPSHAGMRAIAEQILHALPL